MSDNENELTVIEPTKTAYSVSFEVTLGPFPNVAEFRTPAATVEEAKVEFEKYLRKEMQIDSLNVTSFVPMGAGTGSDETPSIN